jgi:hypothetical protein
MLRQAPDYVRAVSYQLTQKWGKGFGALDGFVETEWFIGDSHPSILPITSHARNYDAAMTF